MCKLSLCKLDYILTYDILILEEQKLSSFRHSSVITSEVTCGIHIQTSEVNLLSEQGNPEKSGDPKLKSLNSRDGAWQSVAERIDFL